MDESLKVNKELSELHSKTDRVAGLRSKVFNLEHEVAFLKATAESSRVVVILYHDGYVEVKSRHPVKAMVVCIPPDIEDSEDMYVPIAYEDHLQGKVIASGFPTSMSKEERVDRACANYILECVDDRQQQHREATQDNTRPGEEDCNTQGCAVQVCKP